HGAAGRGSNGPTGQRWRPRGATRALGAAAALLIWLIAAAGPARAGTYTIAQCNYGGSGQRPLLAFAPSSPPFDGYADTCQQSDWGGLDFVLAGGRMNPNESRGAVLSSPNPAITIERVRDQNHSFPISYGSRAFLQFWAFGPSGAQVLRTADIGDSSSGTSADLGMPSGTGGFGVYVYCSTSASTSCYWADPRHVVYLTGTQEILSEDVPPSAAINGGSLLSPGTRRGDQTLAYSASDGESGVARIKVTMGGTVVGDADFSTDPARCPYVAWAACASHISGDSLTVHTNRVDDGTYSVLLTAYDAAGNQASTQRDNITVSNTPQFDTAPTLSGSPQVGHAPVMAIDGHATGLSKDDTPPRIGRLWARCDAEGNGCQPIPGASSATYAPSAPDVGHRLRLFEVAVNDHGTGTAGSDPSPLVLDASGSAGLNGRNASPRARIVLTVAHPQRLRSASFADSAVMLRGQLVNEAGAPVAGAAVEVLQQPQVDGAQLQGVAAARTGDDGSWALRLAPGSSRLVRVAYRYVVGDPEYVAQVDFTQEVGAGVVLHTTRHLRNGQAIRFRGRLLGGFVPPAGKLVELQVLIGRRWQDFKAVRTASNGTFRARRRLTRTSGHVVYAFRVVVRREAGYPFAVGYSRPRVVSVN
ncbi:MAG TPA: hypothetical protein VGY97_06765, partial [Solirubrobacteraceae bacterium]|nr:hypothetical protein [Solirubrobacteraceae bacterium]